MINKKIISRKASRYLNITLNSFLCCYSIISLFICNLCFLNGFSFLLIYLIQSKDSLSYFYASLPYIILSFLFIFTGTCCFISFVVYHIENLLSREFLGFNNKLKENLIEKISILQQEKPVITNTIICYHYYTTVWVDSKGISHTTTHRRNTYTETREFNYQYSNFTGKEFNIKQTSKKYLDLELSIKINHLDNKTTDYYNSFKASIVNDNIHRDTHIEFSENTNINGFSSTFYAKLDNNEKDPFCFNLGINFINN
jgi:hypothetical protein